MPKEVDFSGWNPGLDVAKMRGRKETNAKAAMVVGLVSLMMLLLFLELCHDLAAKIGMSELYKVIDGVMPSCICPYDVEDRLG